MASDGGDFRQRCAGRLWSVMGWDQLTAFWQRIDPAAGWYLLAVGVSPAPTADEPPAPAARVAAFVAGIDALLRTEHRESYCGIVYADDLESPRLVKIYDPNALGSSCGSGKHTPLPGWIMSRSRPDASFTAARPAPEGRRRWWRALASDS